LLFAHELGFLKTPGELGTSSRNKLAYSLYSALLGLRNASSLSLCGSQIRESTLDVGSDTAVPANRLRYSHSTSPSEIRSLGLRASYDRVRGFWAQVKRNTKSKILQKIYTTSQSL
jgi:hypothetical protein